MIHKMFVPGMDNLDRVQRNGTSEDLLRRKTCLYNFYPLKPHFYRVKLGFTGVYIIFFLFLLKNIDCGYSLEPPRGGDKNIDCGYSLEPPLRGGFVGTR